MSDPSVSDAALMVAESCLQRGEREQAFHVVAEVLMRDRDCPRAWKMLGQILDGVSFDAANPAVAALLTAGIGSAAADPERLRVPALRYLLAATPLPELLEAAAGDNVAVLRHALRAGNEALEHPLFLVWIGTLIVDYPPLERLLAQLRKLLLEWHAAEPSSLGSLAFPLALALARQAFLNAYVWPESPEEHAGVVRLLERSASGDDAFSTVLVAAYRPLHACAELSDRIPSLVARFPELSALVRLQWEEPRAEAALREHTETWTTIRDDTSGRVRDQYEEHPYPRWRTLPYLEPQPLAAWLEKTVPGLRGGRVAVPADPRVLIAGCGTGQHPIAASLTYADAEITAIDLSRASLAYARRMAEVYGASRVAFAQADILELSPPAGPYDLIECIGVLHHLADPMAGWRRLLACLKPGGLMRVALYSERARRAVVRCREHVAEQGYTGSTEAIRQLRQEILALPEDAPERGVTRFADFYHTPGCRDLLFHVQESRYTPRQLEAMLRELKLTFLGFVFPEGGSALPGYAARFPHDPRGLSLAQWETYEKDHPDTFGFMYNFFVRKRG